MRNKRSISLVLLAARGVADRVTYPDMRAVPRLAAGQKSSAIWSAYFASNPYYNFLGLKPVSSRCAVLVRAGIRFGKPPGFDRSREASSGLEGGGQGRPFSGEAMEAYRALRFGRRADAGEFRFPR
jgi:hypothetical protein